MSARIQPYDYPCRRRWAKDQITSGFEFGLEALEQTGSVNFAAAPDELSWRQLAERRATYRAYTGNAERRDRSCSCCRCAGSRRSSKSDSKPAAGSTASSPFKRAACHRDLRSRLGAAARRVLVAARNDERLTCLNEEYARSASARLRPHP